jgi:hypothetical protein
MGLALKENIDGQRATVETAAQFLRRAFLAFYKTFGEDEITQGTYE